MHPTRVRLDPDERREQIMKAAREAFHKKGFGQTSMRDLADAVGMSIAGMYHYVGTKDDLLFEIIEAGVERLLAELKVARDSAETPEARIRAMLAATVRMVVDNRGEVRVLAENADKLPPERREAIRARQRESGLMLRAELESMQAAGQMKAINPNVAMFALNGMANWIYFWYDPNGDVSLEALIDQLAEVFFHGCSTSS